MLSTPLTSLLKLSSGNTARDFAKFSSCGKVVLFNNPINFFCIAGWYWYLRSLQLKVLRNLTVSPSVILSRKRCLDGFWGRWKSEMFEKISVRIIKTSRSWKSLPYPVYKENWKENLTLYQNWQSSKDRDPVLPYLSSLPSKEGFPSCFMTQTALAFIAVSIDKGAAFSH